jgi:hypothetical protein
MNKLIRLEELAMLMACIYGLYFLNVDWWVYLLLLIGPDISMLGYAGGNKIGAITYNIFHHKAVAIAVLIAGLLSSNWFLLLTGIVLFGHSSMDRMFGYGLKLFSGFEYTHLGRIGSANNK